MINTKQVNTSANLITEYWKDCSEDKNWVHQHDVHRVSQLRRGLPGGRAPEPWFGIPSQARVFFLTLNPGHRPTDEGPAGHVWKNFAFDMLAERITYQRFCNEATPEALRWVRRTYGAFQNKAVPLICNLRLIAYPSREKSDLGDLAKDIDQLPSARFMRDYVHKHLVPLARNNEIALLVLRSPELWGFGKSQHDRTEGSLFVSKPVRSVSISPSSRVAHIIRPFFDLCESKKDSHVSQQVKPMDRRSKVEQNHQSRMRREVPSEVLSILDSLDECDGFSLRWMRVQTQVWLRDTKLGGYSRVGKHFYLSKRVVDEEIGDISIEDVGFDLKQKSDGHSWWQADSDHGEQFLHVALQLARETIP